MNKQVLSPFDCDMCAMIEDITKQEIEVTASDTSIRLSWAQNGSEGNDKAEGQRISDGNLSLKEILPPFQLLPLFRTIFNSYSLICSGMI